MTTRITISKQVISERTPMTLHDLRNFVKDADAADLPNETVISYNCPDARPLWKPLVGLRARMDHAQET